MPGRQVGQQGDSFDFLGFSDRFWFSVIAVVVVLALWWTGKREPIQLYIFAVAGLFSLLVTAIL